MNFFLIEIHAYRIGDSEPAPYFEVVEKPNDFIKSNKSSKGRSGNLNKAKSECFAFWSEFNDNLVGKGKPFNVRKATTDHWYDVALGKSGTYVEITLVNKDGYIGVSIYINDDKNLFDQLHQNKDDIERELDFELEWNRLDGKKAAKIMSRIPGLNFDDKSNYPKLMEQTIERAALMRDVVKKYL